MRHSNQHLFGAIAVLVLAAGAALAADGTFVVDVVVTDARDQPVQGAEVMCVATVNPWCRTTPLSDAEQAVTDAEGKCTFTGPLSNDQYIVQVVLGDQAYAQSVHFSEYAPRQALTLKLTAARRVAGVIRDDEGQPLSDVTILNWGALPLGKTDEDGKFAVLEVERSSFYNSWLYKEGYGAMSIHFPSPLSYCELAFPEGTSVRGDVKFADGTPAAGVHIESDFFEATTNTQGQFESIPISERKRQVTTFARLHRDDTEYFGKSQDDFSNLPFPELHFVLEPLPKRAKVVGTPAREVLLGGQNALPTAAPAAPASTEANIPVGSVEGKAMLAGSNSPVRGTLYYSQTQEIFVLIEVARTDENGVFVGTNLPPNKGYLRFLPDAPVQYQLGGLVEVDLTDGKAVSDLNLYVDVGCAVRGRVLDANGNPVANQWVNISPGPAYASQCLTDKQGNYQFLHLENPGVPYTLSCDAPGNRKATVRLEALSKGSVSEGVLLSLPAEKPKLAISGTVVNTDGAPVVGASITLQSERGENLYCGTDDLGQFLLTCELDVPVSLQVTGIGIVRKVEWRDQDDGKGESNLSLPCEIIEGGSISLDVGQTEAAARITVKHGPWRVIKGRALNEDGEPLWVRVHMVNGEGRKKDLRTEPGGVFLTDQPVEGPSILEFTAEGYQAIVWESGKQFTVPVENLKVVMKKGPFPEGVPIFTAVTGREATPEEVQAIPGGRYVQGRIREYAKLANLGEKEPQKPAAPPVEVEKAPAEPKKGWKVRITDASGLAVDAVSVQPVATFGTLPKLVPKDCLVPDPNGPRSWITGEDGVFVIPQPWVMIWREGSAYTVFGEPEAGVQEPIAITLHPTAKITVHVTDYSGNPKPGWVVGPKESVYNPGQYGYSALPRTAEDGAATFDRVPPGQYTYGAANANYDPNQPTKYVDFEVEAGQDKHVEIRVGEPVAGSPQAILADWQKENWLFQTERYRFETIPGQDAENRANWQKARRQLIEELDQNARDALSKELVEAIDALPKMSVRRSELSPQFLASAAGLLGDKSTVEPLKRYLSRVQDSESSNPPTRLSPSVADSEEAVQALVDLAGEDLVPFFESLAKDETRPPSVRTAALLGLGKIGTERSAKAFAKIRDEAMSLPGAPKTKEDCSHADKMGQALEMTLFVIPYGGRWTDHAKPVLERARVSSDYVWGQLGIEGYTQIVFRRIGAEWFMVQLGHRVMF